MSMHVEKYCNSQKYGCSMASLAVRRSYEGNTIQDIKHVLTGRRKCECEYEYILNMNKDVRIMIVHLLKANFTETGNKMFTS